MYAKDRDKLDDVSLGTRGAVALEKTKRNWKRNRRLVYGRRSYFLLSSFALSSKLESIQVVYLFLFIREDDDGDDDDCFQFPIC